VEPIPETRELLDYLWAGAEDERLEVWLLTRAQQVAALVPDCVGLSIALLGELGFTFTFVATADDVRLVDGAQYLDGGPCEEAVHHDVLVDTNLLSESTWHLAALAAASTGVRSSLSLPIRSQNDVVGSVNFYGASRATFTGPARHLAMLFGAAAREAVLNADLQMGGIERARRSTEQVVDEGAVHTASGVLAEREGVSPEQARRLLEESAARAGLPVGSLAKLVLADPERADG
jgi:GAF domain-containing protein